MLRSPWLPQSWPSPERPLHTHSSNFLGPWIYQVGMPNPTPQSPKPQKGGASLSLLKHPTPKPPKHKTDKYYPQPFKSATPEPTATCTRSKHGKRLRRSAPRRRPSCDQPGIDCGLLQEWVVGRYKSPSPPHENQYTHCSLEYQGLNTLSVVTTDWATHWAMMSSNGA